MYFWDSCIVPNNDIFNQMHMFPPFTLQKVTLQEQKIAFNMQVLETEPA